MFESLKSLDKGWEDRALESQSLRSMFCCVLVAVFVLGAVVGLAAFEIFRLHRFNWILFGANFLILGSLAFRYGRLIYR